MTPGGRAADCGEQTHSPSNTPRPFSSGKQKPEAAEGGMVQPVSPRAQERCTVADGRMGKRLFSLGRAAGTHPGPRILHDTKQRSPATGRGAGISQPRPHRYRAGFGHHGEGLEGMGLSILWAQNNKNNTITSSSRLPPRQGGERPTVWPRHAGRDTALRTLHQPQL